MSAKCRLNIYICNVQIINKMPISFLIQSKKNPAPIYIRVTEGKQIDAKVRTNFVIDPDRFNKSQIKDRTLPKGATPEIKAEIIKENQNLSDLRSELEKLKKQVSTLINQRQKDEVVNADWLRTIINPKQGFTKIPTLLTDFFEDYHQFKDDNLKRGTIKNNNVIKARVIEFEKDFGKVKVQDVNKKFSLAFQKWSKEKGYDHNTTVKSIKTIKMICRHARDRGAKISFELDTINKGLRYKNNEPIFLSLKEIDLIINAEMSNERLEIARDWLVISCFTAQRVSDFLRFDTKRIIELDGVKFLDITQRKTQSQVLLPLTPEVLHIIDKWNGNFPPLYSKNVASNEAMYNEHIKTVCSLAEIDEMVTAKLKNKKTNRYETVQVPKYKAVSSHIGRRSYATNYYGKIPTPLLISATGHSSETQFLRYVGKKGTHNAMALARAMRNLASISEGTVQLKKVNN